MTENLSKIYNIYLYPALYQLNVFCLVVFIYIIWGINWNLLENAPNKRDLQLNKIHSSHEMTAKSSVWVDISSEIKLLSAIFVVVIIFVQTNGSLVVPDIKMNKKLKKTKTVWSFFTWLYVVQYRGIVHIF